MRGQVCEGRQQEGGGETAGGPTAGAEARQQLVAGCVGVCGCVCASFWGRTCRWPFRTKFSWASNFSGVVFSGGVVIDVVFGTGFQPVNPPASGPSGPGPSEGQGGAPGHKGPHAVACPPCGVPPMRCAPHAQRKNLRARQHCGAHKGSQDAEDAPSARIPSV